jgi:hypothetical protein
MDVVRDWKDSAGQNDLIEFITWQTMLYNV